MMNIKSVVIFILLLGTSLFSQWERQDLPDNFGMVLSVDFADENNGIAGGWYLPSMTGRIVYTTNGGENWLNASYPDSTRSITSVHYISNKVLYAFGAYDTTPKKNYEYHKLTKIVKEHPFIGREMKSIGLSAADSTGGMFLKSNDGGISWHKANKLPDEIHFITSSTLIADSTVYLIGNAANYAALSGIYKYLIRNESWEKVLEIDTTSYLQRISFNSSFGVACGWAANDSSGLNGVIYKTIDEGETWNVSEFPDVEHFNNVFLMNDSTAFVAGVSQSIHGVIYKSVDYGVTWQEMDSVPNSIYFDAIAFEENSGKGLLTAVDTAGGQQIWLVYVTYDYGETWSLQELPEQYPNFILYSVIMPFENNWYISGGNFDEGIILHTDNGGVTSINSTELPTEFYLSDNYPNPFNPTTNIVYQIPQEGRVVIKLYDILGGEIQTLVNEHKSQGRFEFTFDGSRLSSGVYIYRITSGKFSASKKFILMK
ncbi:MAG: T9SS type A sorting domain-containing protein [Melioribacteraceae bacterium]|nr:T9SS type A sorting domain-containing protein [Melioribacteraceae bacterium]MCF8353558.1 T9SS type A sorting domain-containing protein [Melioribacteraceae bacterium]MCF8392508.1 T9SS type A sorting domain-containing protein [Melioribacteraceae bacterium]MCF8418477.1 T9SS type A sorting domain-containing protein [Melioribacteraceae bacterium]